MNQKNDSDIRDTILIPRFRGFDVSLPSNAINRKSQYGKRYRPVK